MKVCKQCGLTKPKNQFYRCKRWYHGKCRECRDTNARKLRLERVAYLHRLKMRPCADCGIQYNPWVMQFDHIKGTKIKDVSALCDGNMDRLNAEIEKCEIVCANCHWERTHRRKQIFKYEPTNRISQKTAH